MSMGESTLQEGHFKQKNVFFRGVYLGTSWGNFSLISSSVLINIEMDFDTKASNIILVIFQMEVNFQQNGLFQHTYVCLNEKFI